LRTADGLARVGAIVLTMVACFVIRENPARAADDVEAILKRGTELRRQNRDSEALAEFQRASRIQGSPRVDAQMALAEQALGLWLEAHTHLSHALERGNDAWIKKNRTPLDQALATIRTHLGLVEIWGEPAGAEVQLDGKVVGKLPQVSLWLAAASGGVPLQVTAEGYVTLSKILIVPDGVRIREHVALRSSPQPLATTAAAASSPGSATAPKLAAAPPTETEAATLIAKPGQSAPTPASDEGAAADDVPVYRTWWFWTLVGAGALAAGGVTAWVVTHRSGAGDTCTGACSTWGTNP